MPYSVNVCLEIDESELSEDTKERLLRKVDRLSAIEAYRLSSLISDYYTLVFDSGEFYGLSEEEKKTATVEFVSFTVENFYNIAK